MLGYNHIYKHCGKTSAKGVAYEREACKIAREQHVIDLHKSEDAYAIREKREILGFHAVHAQ